MTPNERKLNKKKLEEANALNDKESGNFTNVVVPPPPPGTERS